jgi:hypothetical protein
MIWSKGCGQSGEVVKAVEAPPQKNLGACTPLSFSLISTKKEEVGALLSIAATHFFPGGPAPSSSFLAMAPGGMEEKVAVLLSFLRSPLFPWRLPVRRRTAPWKKGLCLHRLSLLLVPAVG